MKKYNKDLLPHNYFAERSVLSILINYPYSFEKASIYLSKESFFLSEHKIIYETLVDLDENKKPITLTTIITKLQDKGQLVKIGGLKTLIQITKNLQPVTNLKEYLNLLNEKFIRRKLINLGKDLVEWGFLTSYPLEEIFEDVEQSIFEISKEKMVENTPTCAELLLDTLEELQRKNKKDEITGFATSFKELDTILQGFQKTDVIVIAGRPSMGKTAFGLNVAKNIVQNYKVPIIFFSLEMSKQQLMYRLLSMEAYVSGSKLKRGQMTKDEWLRIKNAADRLSKLPIYIDDNPSISLTEIKAKIRKIMLNHKEIGLVLIDYLQLMKLNIKLQNRVQEIAHITRNLKAIAKEFNMPLIVLSQLSRNVESRMNKRPILSDLRESGCITNKKKEKKKIQFWNGKEILRNHQQIFIFKGKKPSFKHIENFDLTGNHKILSSKGWLKMFEIRKKNFKLNLKKNSILENFPVKYSGIKNVYDIEIPNYHNFLKNSLILHNSIEQDADVVLMLYRDDYYKAANPKNVTRSITDIIVAKHRNGPVGNASVLFDTNITKFFDIQ